MLVKFSNPEAKLPPYAWKESFETVPGGISLASASLLSLLAAAAPINTSPASGPMGTGEGMGWWHGEGGTGTAVGGRRPRLLSPRGVDTWVWAALGRRSVAGEPPDQHAVQVHQIDCPGHQPGADPCHRRDAAGYSLPEEGDHVSAKSANQVLQMACSHTSAKVRRRWHPL